MKRKIVLSILLVLSMIVFCDMAYAITPTPTNYTLLKKIDINNSTDYPVITTKYYSDLMNSTMGNDQDWESFDAGGIMSAIMKPGTDNLGPYFWILVFGAIGLLIYLKTDSILIPGSLYLIGGGLIGPMLMPEFAGVIWGIVIVGFAAIGYLLFRSR